MHIVTLLINAGAISNVVNNSGETPLSLSHSEEVFRFLTDHAGAVSSLTQAVRERNRDTIVRIMVEGPTISLAEINAIIAANLPPEELEISSLMRERSRSPDSFQSVLKFLQEVERPRSQASYFEWLPWEIEGVCITLLAPSITPLVIAAIHAHLISSFNPSGK
jgi:hypothetical protein